MTCKHKPCRSVNYVELTESMLIWLVDHFHSAIVSEGLLVSKAFINEYPQNFFQ